MVISKTILFIIAIVCRILEITFSVANIPVSLVHDALEAMSHRADSISNNIKEEITRH